VSGHQTWRQVSACCPKEQIDSASGVSTTTVKYSPSNELSQTLIKLNLSNLMGCRASTLSDEPTYDSVVSDDDYNIILDKDESRPGSGRSR
jgi:hypothetical protein